MGLFPCCFYRAAGPGMSYAHQSECEAASSVEIKRKSPELVLPLFGPLGPTRDIRGGGLDCGEESGFNGDVSLEKLPHGSRCSHYSITQHRLGDCRGTAGIISSPSPCSFELEAQERALSSELVKPRKWVWNSGGPGFPSGGGRWAAMGQEEASGREKPRFGMCSSGSPRLVLPFLGGSFSLPRLRGCVSSLLTKSPSMYYVVTFQESKYVLCCNSLNFS